MASVEFENRLWKAQDGRCSICGGHLLRGERFRDDTGWSLDHVYPRSRYKYLGTRGNVTLAHKLCNSVKGNRDPTGCEIILLHALNARIGHDLVTDRSYSDRVEGPSALAVALQAGFTRWRMRDREAA
jgi:hypothetical protein